MDRNSSKALRRSRRRIGIRKRLVGTAPKPRLAIYKSLNHKLAQIINDLDGVTIASAATNAKELSLDKTGNSSAAAKVGELLAKRAETKGVKEVVFDRGGFKFHGRVKALADNENHHEARELRRVQSH
ncbi:MAG: 50S ribosomal protein L18 [Planctomycetota bacterium]|nr:50S ribosomal protein L18 [Planctomycetota bacterium]